MSATAAPRPPASTTFPSEGTQPPAPRALSTSGKLQGGCDAPPAGDPARADREAPRDTARDTVEVVSRGPIRLSERRLAGALAGGLVMAWLLPAGFELGVRLGDALPLAGRAALGALILGALALGWRAALREEVSRG